MPRLQGFLVVLENNFNEIRYREECRAFRWSPLDRIHTEDFGDVKIIRKLQRGIRINVGDPVNSVSLFPIDERCRVGKHKCLCRCDISIMEWSLRVGPGCIRCQVPPSRNINKEKISIVTWIQPNISNIPLIMENIIGNYMSMPFHVTGQWKWLAMVETETAPPLIHGIYPKGSPFWLVSLNKKQPSHN